MHMIKRVAVLALALMMAVGMACPAFAAQTHTIEDTIFPFYGEPAQDYLVKIQAEEVKEAGTVHFTMNYGTARVYQCKGPVNLTLADCVAFVGVMDSFVYAKNLEDLVNLKDWEWVSSVSGPFTKPGAYLFAASVSYFPAKVVFVFVIEEDGAAVPPVQSEEYALKSFSDVPAGKWSHAAIMEMVELGMFNGTQKPDKNGVGAFDPAGTMTRGQFITVVTRHLYQAELDGMAAGAYWYSNNYDVAVKYGLISDKEFSMDDMAKPISRQEMALMAVRAVEAKGVAMPEKADKAAIADFESIDSRYQDFVRQAFSMGLLTGYDDQGTFGPGHTLTREQGAMVAYRIVHAGEGGNG